MLSLSIDFDFDIGDIIYCIRANACADGCEQCYNGNLHSFVEQNEVCDVRIVGSDYPWPVSIKNPVRFEVLLSNGKYVDVKRLFMTKEEAENNLNNEDFWILVL